MRCILFRPMSNGTGERPEATVSQHAELEEALAAVLPPR
jgi:hypothetical protein